VDIVAVRHVYALRPLTQGIVSLLTPEVDISGLAEDLVQVGIYGDLARGQARARQKQTGRPREGGRRRLRCWWAT